MASRIRAAHGISNLDRGFVTFPPPRSFLSSAGSNAYACADMHMHMHMVMYALPEEGGQSMWGPIS